MSSDDVSPKLVSAMIGRGWTDAGQSRTVLDDPMPKLDAGGPILARVRLVCIIQLAAGCGEFTISTNLVGNPLTNERLHTSRYRWPEGEALTVIPVVMDITLDLSHENVNWFQVMIDGVAVAELPIEVRDLTRPVSAAKPVGETHTYQQG